MIRNELARLKCEGFRLEVEVQDEDEYEELLTFTVNSDFG